MFFGRFEYTVLMSANPQSTTWDIQLLESPIPTTTPATTTTTTSQKASSGDISGTKRGIIDPLVSKQPEKYSE